MADTGTCWDRTQRRMIPRAIHRPYKLTTGDQGRIRSRARSAHTVAEAMNEAIQYSFMSMCPCTTYRTISPFPSMHAHDSSRVVSIGVNNCSLYCKAARNPRSAGVFSQFSIKSHDKCTGLHNNYNHTMKIASVRIVVIAVKQLDLR
jgi:hypothetical protein